MNISRYALAAVQIVLSLVMLFYNAVIYNKNHSDQESEDRCPDRLLTLTTILGCLVVTGALLSMCEIAYMTELPRKIKTYCQRCCQSQE